MHIPQAWRAGQRLGHIFPEEREGCVSLSQQQRSLGWKAGLAGEDFVRVTDATFLWSALTAWWVSVCAHQREKHRFGRTGVTGQWGSTSPAHSTSQITSPCSLLLPLLSPLLCPHFLCLQFWHLISSSCCFMALAHLPVAVWGHYHIWLVLEPNEGDQT